MYAKGVIHTGFSASGLYGAPADAIQGSQELKVAFTTFQGLILDSLTISISQGSLSCSSNKNPKINLSVYKPKDANFPEIKKTITFSCVDEGEGLYKIPVGIALDNAGEYALKVALASSGNTYRLDFYAPTTNLYPKSVPNLISITGDDDGDDNSHLIPALFDWVISMPNDARLEAINTKDCSLALPTFYLEKSEEANIFPNPFQEDFTVDWKKHETAHLSILDASGKVLETQNLKGALITRMGGNLKPGLYLIKLDAEYASYQAKIIKK